jgi:ABC-type uncharacterized transport system substrate-binding protein
VIKRPHRRALLGGVVSLASAIMFASEAAHGQQQVSLRHIGVLLVGWSCEGKELQEFRLRDAGYADGRDVVIECRSAKGDFNQIPKLATDIVKEKADVIVADSTLATRAFKRATSTIPIVMARVADPVGSGLVASLSHPGGNVTGLSLMVTELSAKRLELLKEAIPQLTRVAVLRNPATPWHPKVIEALKAAAPSMSIELSVVGAETADELDLALLAVSRSHAQALYVIEDGLFDTHRTRLLKLAYKARLPTMYANRAFVDEGALMSYGPSVGDLFRESADYVDKILKGAKPGDLAIEQPAKLELVVNLKTAKAFALYMPESILVRANEVIR